MAIYRERPCPICNGRGCITISTENSISCVSCEECFSTGYVTIPITNNERINELITPEEKLKFFKGFSTNAKYSSAPRRILNPEECDDDMLEWFNKVSDELDDYIFENR